MSPFTYNGLATRVIFGSGTLDQLGEAVASVGGQRVLVLSTPQQADMAKDVHLRLGDVAVAQFSGATMHTPVDVTADAMRVVEAEGIDCLVAIGGGSTIGLGKALALRTDLPQVVVPTTYAGSEMTPILGQTEQGRKTTQRSPKIQPEVVLYDVDLTLSLPVGMSVTSGVNAMAHAVEALYAQDRNPLISMACEEAVRALAESLPRIVANPGDVAARTQALYGAWLCGLALGSVGMSLHHKLCHTLGGSFDLPHAETHTVVLPHALAYNAPFAPEAVERLQRALGVDDPAQGLFDLAHRLGAPTALKDLGMAEAGIAQATAIALENPYWNPRPLEAEPIEALIRRAWSGERPR